ncbi:MAG: hypothetical protein ACJ0UT_13280 [Candidatus Latescibacterota bacterium]
MAETRVEARSTLSARFADKAISGPGLDQQAVLFLHYFPGDGEAVVRTVVEGTSVAQLKNAQAALGQVSLGKSTIEIDYSMRPMTEGGVDTLYIDLVADEKATLSWSIAVHSSLDPTGPAAHRLAVDLAVESPPPISWWVEPQQVYQGEQFELRAMMRYDNAVGPEVEEVLWEWPRELAWQEGDAPESWNDGLVPGQIDTLAWDVRAAGAEPGRIALNATARASGQSASPLPKLELQIDPLPAVRLEADFMEVGKRGQISCVWRNDNAEPIRLEALRLEVNHTFSDVSLLAAPDGAALIQDEETQGRSVLVDGLNSLEPGQEVRVLLQAVPQRPGPFTWPSACKPVGRAAFIALRGENTVNAVWGGIAEAESAEGRVRTDLELVNGAFAQALDRQVGTLPMAPGTRIYLKAEDEKNEANWVVEDALIDALQKRGYRVLVRQSEDLEADVVYYRLVRARVVYSQAKQGFFRWGKQQRREAYGDLFLRLETVTDRIVRWDRHIQAYDWDLVSKGSIGVLGGGDMIEQTVVKQENKAIERSLSSGIIGGLFYIFFIL